MTASRFARTLLRPLVGREQALWRTLPLPRLRFWAFGDVLDALVYSVLATRRAVYAVQIGSNDGRRNDPLWPFRDYGGLRGLLVEPSAQAFDALRRNYAPYAGRFSLAQVAVCAESGLRPFFSFAPAPALPAGAEQLGTLDEELLRAHARALRLPESSVQSVDTRCVTFDELCTENGVGGIDVLLIDAEGSDFTILRQVDLAARGVILLAFEHCHLSEDDLDAAHAMLRAGNYDLLAHGSDTIAIDRRAAGTSAIGRTWSAVKARLEA
jgi:FkbM family methyltransferase